MTENQEQELFNILGTLVTEVREIKRDVQEIKSVQVEHSQILGEHSQILGEHSQVLKRLEAKTDSIAEIVINNEKRLTNIEKEVEDLRGSIH